MSVPAADRSRQRPDVWALHARTCTNEHGRHGGGRAPLWQRASTLSVSHEHSLCHVVPRIKHGSPRKRILAAALMEQAVSPVALSSSRANRVPGLWLGWAGRTRRAVRRGALCGDAMPGPLLARRVPVPCRDRRARASTVHGVHGVRGEISEICGESGRRCTATLTVKRAAGKA